LPGWLAPPAQDPVLKDGVEPSGAVRSLVWLQAAANTKAATERNMVRFIQDILRGHNGFVPAIAPAASCAATRLSRRETLGFADRPRGRGAFIDSKRFQDKSLTCVSPLFGRLAGAPRRPNAIPSAGRIRPGTTITPGTGLFGRDREGLGFVVECAPNPGGMSARRIFSRIRYRYGGRQAARG
jgi:hypothetical protein